MPDVPASAPRILVVDDEPDLRDLLAYNLEREGYTVATAADGHEALALAAATPPDLVLLDVMMPNLDGLATCRRLREHAHLRTLPVLMLTALDADADTVRGLDVGADAYLSKDVSMPVLLSHVKALLRGADRHDAPATTLRLHGLEISRERYLVFRDVPGGASGAEAERESVRLPRKEFELLHFLATRPGKVYTRHDLLDRVWGRDVFVVERTVDVHVRKIREKLGDELDRDRQGRRLPDAQVTRPGGRPVPEARQKNMPKACGWCVISGGAVAEVHHHHVEARGRAVEFALEQERLGGLAQVELLGGRDGRLARPEGLARAGLYLHEHEVAAVVVGPRRERHEVHLGPVEAVVALQDAVAEAFEEVGGEGLAPVAGGFGGHLGRAVRRRSMPRHRQRYGPRTRSLAPAPHAAMDRLAQNPGDRHDAFTTGDALFRNAPTRPGHRDRAMLRC